MNPVNLIKYIYSVILLIFSIILITALIFTGQTGLAKDVHPVFAFVMLWVALIWLTMVEGGQASMVGLPPIDRDLYKNSHPISHQICEYGHRGDNLDRYLMGRQFMVLLCVFTVNNSGAPVGGAEVLGLPDWVTQIFLGTGLAMILLTCMVGQLNTQVNASHCMLDYINTHFMSLTLYVAMAIEASGLLHSSYLIQIIVAQMAGKPIESNEPPRSAIQNGLFWARILFSTVLLVAAMIFTLAALFDGKTTMWAGVPAWIAVILFFFFMSVVGMLEAMQIAFFAFAKLTEEEQNSSMWSRKTSALLFGKGGRGLPGFMIGRQLCVVSCMFFVARVTTMSIPEGETNVMGVPDGVQTFFGTGLLGAFITTIIASIAWQLVASAFPMAFMASPITYFLLRLCLLLEATGICAGAWVIAYIHKDIAGFQKDEVYVGTAEEREAGLVKAAFKSEVGHLTGGAFPANKKLPLPAEFKDEDISKLRSAILKNVRTLREHIAVAGSDKEKAILMQSLKLEFEALDHLNKKHLSRHGHSEKLKSFSKDPTISSGGVTETGQPPRGWEFTDKAEKALSEEDSPAIAEQHVNLDEIQANIQRLEDAKQSANAPADI